MKHIRVLALILVIALGGCAHTAAAIYKAANRCPTSSFRAYSQCLTPLVATSKRPIGRELASAQPRLLQRVDAGTITGQQAYDWCQSKLVKWDRQEADVWRGVGAVVGVVTAVAVVALTAYAVSKGGGSSSPHTTKDNSGCCSHHRGLYLNIYGRRDCMYAVHRWRCNDGTPSPTCSCPN